MLRFALAGTLLLAASPTMAQTLPQPLVPPPAPATRSGLYLKLDTGGSFGANDTIDQSAIIGGGVGYKLGHIRLEGEFNYRPDFNQSTNFGVGPGPKTGLTNWTAMANAYYDFSLASMPKLVPYIGGGIGIAQNKVDGTTVNVSGTDIASFTGSSKDQFAWQAMAGVGYYFTPHIALDVGYRYIDAGSAESGTGTVTHIGEVASFAQPLSGDVNAHEVDVSLRFQF